jgi:2-hydroxychromene-2-carboxylate isomerase
MARSVDYCFSVASPWAYLGSARFIEMTEQHKVHVNVLPLDYTRVFAASGGLLYENRAPQRRAYRQVDLARWSRHLGIPLNLEPRFYRVDRRPASYLLIAARAHGSTALTLSHAILCAVWRDDGNIADWDTLKKLCDQTGLDGQALVDEAQGPEIASCYERDTDKAIADGVFGAPSYLIDGEIFWGQDRLEFVDRKLAKGWASPGFV